MEERNLLFIDNDGPFYTDDLFDDEYDEDSYENDEDCDTVEEKNPYVPNAYCGECNAPANTNDQHVRSGYDYCDRCDTLTKVSELKVTNMQCENNRFQYELGFFCNACRITNPTL